MGQYPKLIALRLRPAQVQQLQQLAERRQSSVSALVRGAIERTLDEDRRRPRALPAGARAKAAG